MIEDRQHDSANRNWLFVPYDQLSAGIGPLATEDPRTLGIVVIENPWKAALRPYHKQKLALVIGNLRHFALEQAERGVAVRHIVAQGPYRSALSGLAHSLGPVRVMRPAERELRADLQPLFDSGELCEIAHEGWLSTREQFLASHPNGARYLLERFYRFMRKASGVLMENGRPAGGDFNFDKENRSAFKAGRDPIPQPPPSFPSDPVKEEAGRLIERVYAHHPGKLNLDSLPVTAADAEHHWQWALANCLPWFGKYEDAMYSGSSTLFHTRISALLNLHRLLPARIVRDVAALDIAIASKEGFIRQILGWREFMHHVHEETDGFRKMPDANAEVAVSPGDGGYGRWSGAGWEGPADCSDGGSLVSTLGADAPLPPAYWGRKSGLNCLDQVIAGVWEEGWSHHITRLMILSNLACLLDVSPRELTDWFWVAYIDAYDWVVEPNVLGLGTFATGQLFTTKPYVSGANYIHRMSDYCEGCRFVPGKTCPFTPLYWAFLDRHRPLLEGNQRLRIMYRGARSDGAHQDVFERVRELLVAGEELTPSNVHPPT